MSDHGIVDLNVGQGVAAYVDWLNRMRLSDLAASLDWILTHETDALADADVRLANAMANLDWAKANVENLIDTNRGGGTGLHGFIAEFAETGIANARRAVEGMRRSTVVLNDNGPVDLMVHGHGVQMKFYADLRSELETAAGYRRMDMMFPKDHVEVFRAVMNGKNDIRFDGQRLSGRQIERIRKLIEEESESRGLPWDKWMRPSKLDYGQVQKESIGRTFNQEAERLDARITDRKMDIGKDADGQRADAWRRARPNLGEAHKGAGVGAAMQGGANLGLFIYERHKAGREVWQFTVEDWKACGLTTAEGAFKGGFTGYAVYGLTNVCRMSAPSAGAVAAGTFGLIDAVIRFRSGEIDDDGFLNLLTMNAIDATGTAVGAAIGQAVIPIPVVGALIGSIGVSTVLGIGKGILNRREQALLDDYRRRMGLFVAGLDERYARILEDMLADYRRLGDVQRQAFDLDVNVRLRFESSIAMARAAGVDEHRILHDEAEIDDFFRM